MAGANSNIPTIWVEQFSSNITTLVQQRESRLRHAVMTGSHVGSQASPVDQVGAVNANLVDNRYGPMVPVDAPFARRWVFPNDYDITQYIDSFDKLRLIVDPTSAMVNDAVFALNRAIDTQILSGLIGTNYVGNQGTTTQALPAAEVVGVLTGAASATNYTVAKMIAAKQILWANEAINDMPGGDEIYSALNGVNLANLLKEVQVVSTDFNDHPVLVEGVITRFLGVNLIHTELLTVGTDDQSGTSTACPLWVKSGAYAGLWDDVSTDVSRRNDLRSIPYQIYVKGTFGATRLEEKKVVQIWAR